MSWGETVAWVTTAAVGAGAAALSIYAAVKRPGKGRYLCEDCKFNNEQACLKPERPHATICTSYRQSTSSDAR